jgi:F0F1-type ATP synthase assembly protein I
MENPLDKKDSKKTANWAKYSAIGFQMFATIGVITFIGYKIDEYKKSETYLITAFFGLAGVGIALYQVIKQVTKE